MNDYVDGVPKSEINDFKDDFPIISRDTIVRICEFCEKDLTGQAIQFTTELTKRVGYKKHQTKTIHYCTDCKSKNNM